MSNKKSTLIESVRNIAGTKQLHESRMAEVDQILQDVASGELDAYQVMNSPSSPEEEAAAQQLQNMYDQVAQDRGLHPDDQFEEILDAVCDQLAQEYGSTMESVKPKKMSKEVLEMRKQAGLPLVEGWDDDDDEDPDVKIAMKDRRQQAYEKRKKAEDEKEAAATPAPKKEAPKAAEEKPKASGGSFSAIARQVLKAGGNAAAVKAACEKAGVTVPNHLHSRLHGIKKNLKEGYVLIHPQMPSFVLAENPAMNQYQWISEKDNATALLPIIFETPEAAEKVKKYVYEYKNQLAVVTPVKFED